MNCLEKKKESGLRSIISVNLVDRSDDRRYRSVCLSDCFDLDWKCVVSIGRG